MRAGGGKVVERRSGNLRCPRYRKSCGRIDKSAKGDCLRIIRD